MIRGFCVQHEQFLKGLFNGIINDAIHAFKSLLLFDNSFSLRKICSLLFIYNKNNQWRCVLLKNCMPLIFKKLDPNNI